MISRIGVIGAGQMGSGIAQICARAGYEVKLSDISTEALARGVELISANLARQVARGKITEADHDAALAAIETGTEYSLFAPHLRAMRFGPFLDLDHVDSPSTPI